MDPHCAVVFGTDQRPFGILDLAGQFTELICGIAVAPLSPMQPSVFGAVHNYQPHCEKARLSRSNKSTRGFVMSRRFVVAMLGLGLALFFIPQISLAVDDHILQAIEHTNQAIDDGKHGRADGVATHAEAALTHAEASEKVKSNPHTAEAIKHLKEAIDEGKQGHADVATTHAEAALNHLQQVM
jgi:Small metal-binding protein